MPRRGDGRKLLREPPLLRGELDAAAGNSLAAGSAIAAGKLLQKRGAKNIRFIHALTAPEGIRALRRNFPEAPIYTAALDSHLNENGYIVPGLGDAGDRCFGC